MNEISGLRFFINISTGWVIIAVLAVADGIVREAALTPLLGSGPAHMMSGLFMFVVVFGTAILVLGWGRPKGQMPLIWGGTYWVGLIVLLEWGVVTLRGQTFMDLLSAYHPAHLMEGQLILPGLIFTALSLWIAARVMTPRP